MPCLVMGAVCIGRVNARAEVDIGFGDAELRLQISDNGRGHRNPGGGSGNGLAGMRERVSLYGGDFWAGPMDQGFRVVARLPLEPSPA